MPRTVAPFKLKAAASAVMLAMLSTAETTSAAGPLPAGVVPQLKRVIDGNAVVSAPVPTASGNLLTVCQAKVCGAQDRQRAIIEWNSFNIASGSEVQFVQPNAGAATLNRIFDLDPSVIQGKLTANGQVYLINQNGIVFDKGSQVNVHTLVASTLNLSDDVFLKGLTSAGGLPAFAGSGDSGPASIDLLGNIETQAGGSVLVFAPRITNKGTITAPDGQVILAAGEKVWLTVNDGTDPRIGAEFSMRGLVVEFQAASGPVNLNSVISNQGTISSPRGNVSLAALAINQGNRVVASTAVLQNGSVWLLATEKGDSSAGRRGAIVLGQGSVTATPLDSTDTTTLADDQDYSPYRARIRIEGQTIYSQGRIESPGGIINLEARDAIDPSNHDTSRIFLDAGSVTTAAGTWADLPMSKNLITVQLTSNELKDAPAQKGGVLQGQQVTLDTRKGTPLFDASGFIGAVKRSISEKTASGGEIDMFSQGDVVVHQQAMIDVSGGGYRFSGGALATTKLLSGGRVYDIGQASPDLPYSRILNAKPVSDSRWGVVKIAGLGAIGTTAYEPADVEGKPGGILNIIGQGGTVIDGALLGSVVAGRHQLDPASVPAGAHLVLGDPSSLGSGAPSFGQSEVVFARGGVLPIGFSLDNALPTELRGKATVPLSAFAGSGPAPGGVGWQFGFGSVELYADDRIELPAGQTLALAPGTDLILASHHVTIDGTISAPGGSIALAGLRTVSDAGLPVVTLGPTGVLAASGLWVNESAAATAGQSTVQAVPRFIHAGSISVASGDVLFAPGSLVDASAGARLTLTGSLVAGKAGSIKLRTGGGTDDLLTVGTVALDGQLRAYGFGAGGSLDIHASSLRIANAPRTDPLELWLPPDFFQQGGFGAYSVAGIDNAVVIGGTLVHPQAQVLVLDRTEAGTAPSGTGILQVAAPQLPMPIDIRTPANLTVAASGIAASLSVEPGATIELDPQGQLSLTATNGLSMRGRAVAPAGSITLSLQFTQPGVSTQALLIGEEAQLLVPGQARTRPNAQGLLLGQILPGGQVTIKAIKSALVVEQGATIDVSGTSALLDVQRQPVGVPGYQRQHIGGDAGSVSVTATDRALLDATLIGHSGGPSSAGGSFAFDFLSETVFDASFIGALPHRLEVSQAALSGRDRAVQPTTTDAYVTAAQLEAGGFDKVRLRSSDTVLFHGAVTMSAGLGIRIDAPEIAGTGGTVSLTAARVALGSSLGVDGLPRQTKTTDGSGTFEVAASGAGATGVLDLFGTFTLNGFQEVHLRSAGDLRVTGDVLNLVADEQNLPDTIRGSLTTSGNLFLQAAQIYPTTLTDYALQVKRVQVSGGVPSYQDVAGSSIEVAGGSTPGVVLSAGGSLTLQAQSIVQAGVLRAPLGSISLMGQDSVVVGAGSVTSVSGAGAGIPYGVIQNGQTWTYAGIQITAPPVKGIDLKATNVTVAKGATLSVAGGGDIQAYEFVAGPGGSTDFLLGSATYAIVPGLGSAFGPYDAQFLSEKELGLGSDRTIYDSVYLSGSAGLPAGTYALLPGHYALLPGAYIVQPQTASKYQDLSPGQRASLADGTPVIAGYLTAAGTNLRDSRWSGFAVLPGSAASARSEYQLSGAQFFADQARAADRTAPPLPRDAGRLALSASQSLVLNGAVNALPGNGGSAGEVDISASAIAVVGSPGQAGHQNGALELDATDLSRLGTRLLLGGVRDPATNAVSVAATDITVANDAKTALSAPEVTLVATDQITVRSGSRIEGTGASTGTAADISVVGDGALLRASSGPQISVARSKTTGNAGTLVIESGAVVSADHSLLLDATADTIFKGQLAIGQQGSLSLSARAVSLGETASVAGGLILDNQQLAAFAGLDTLILRSYQTIDLYGNTVLGSASLKHLVLDGAGLSGYRVAQDNAAQVSAGTIVLQNSTKATSASTTATGTGSLSVRADGITFGSGDKTLTGFSSVEIDAASQILGSGTGNLTTTADLTLRAARITGQAASVHTISAGKVDITPSQQTSSTSFEPLQPGAALSITGTSIADAGRIDLPAGQLALTSTSGDVVLASGSQINAAAYQKLFGSQNVAAGAGTVTLASQAGNITIARTASIDVSAAGLSADAGALVLSAPAVGSIVTVAGQLNGRGAEGAPGGSFSLDIGALADIRTLAEAAGTGGFTGAQSIRVRTGDTKLSPDLAMKAREVRISVDAGSLSIDGVIDASSSAGGSRVDLFAGQALNLGAHAVIDARGVGVGTGPADRNVAGGKVNVAARNGMVSFSDGARIDVSATAKGDAGAVTFTAGRTASTGVRADLQGTIAANAGAGGEAGEVVIVGNRVYSRSSVDATVVAAIDSNPIWHDYSQFVDQVDAPGIVRGLKLEGIDSARVSVRPGIEIQSTASMSTTGAWDLASAGWRRNGTPGVLTLRAANTLDVRNAIGFPNDNLVAGESWSIKLVGGADLSSADPLAVQALPQLAAGGSVLLSSALSTVRTGTGNIDIAAGVSFQIGNAGAVVYTAGKPGFGGGATNLFPTHGGDIRITAQQDITGPGAPAFVNDWLRRTTTRDGALGGWRVNRATVRQAVATLGGGDIELHAGRDVVNLYALAATTGRPVASTTPATIDVQGGGDLVVDAGRDVLGGQYLVSLGTGTLRARRQIGGDTGTALYLMGLSGDPAQQGASIAVSAVGNVTIDNVSNPTILAMSNIDGSNVPTAYLTYFTYAPTSAVTIASLGGNVVIGNQAPTRKSRVNAGDIASTWSDIAPPRFQVTAFAGNISERATTGGPIRLYPSSQGGLKLAAGGSISSIGIGVGDAAPDTLAQWDHALATGGEGVISAQRMLFGALAPDRLVAPNPAPGYAFQISADRNIANAVFSIPQRSTVEAGVDIVNLQADLQNLSANDVTAVRGIL